MLARYTHLRSSDLAAKMAVLEGAPPGVRPARPESALAGEELPASTNQRIAWRAASGNKDVLNEMIKDMPIRDVAANFCVSDTACPQGL